MKSIKQLEFSILVRDKQIQDLNLKINELENELNKYRDEAIHKTKQYEFLRHSESKEIERLNNIINDYEDRFKLIKKIVEDNILEELDDFSYCCMMSTIGSVCDGKPGLLNILQGVDKE